MYSELAGCSATPQLAPPQPEVFASASPALVSTGSSREPLQPPGFSTPAGGVENHNHLQLLHRHCLIRLQLPWCHLLNWRWHPHRHLLLHPVQPPCRHQQLLLLHQLQCLGVRRHHLVLSFIKFTPPSTASQATRGSSLMPALPPPLAPQLAS